MLRGLESHGMTHAGVEETDVDEELGIGGAPSKEEVITMEPVDNNSSGSQQSPSPGSEPLTGPRKVTRRIPSQGKYPRTSSAKH
ncbi:hypothetical protein NDU88_001589 [Pleurodeles waltl]|uniref:Uncharacterized protein n=1 Tax=Pleurodeles waltl TaxID=8319 RepID=A0AAV7P699_PLEWA|nr:hypothetical protein NDU88_001589 [Pleurodeles waltl]